MGGALTSGRDSWGKRVGEGMPRCAKETEVKPGVEVQVASLRGGYGPHEGAPHCHVRASSGSKELCRRKDLEGERGWEGTILGPQRQAPLFVFLEGRHEASLDARNSRRSGPEERMPL